MTETADAITHCGVTLLAYNDISILVIDDERPNVDLLCKILRRAGYENVHGATDPYAALALAASDAPDIVLLDLHMPQLNGVEVMRTFRDASVAIEPLVVILTGDDSREAKAHALSNGAKDFITKPFDNQEVVLRINNLADLRRFHKNLDAQVRARTLELEAARLDVIERLGMAAEFRDDATGQHTRRVGKAAALVASALNLPDDYVDVIGRAAPLHDVGKIAIPDRILLKPGPLDVPELEVMRTHTTVGARLLESSNSPLLKLAGEIALTHHERWIGDGYPRGLRGADIPLAGRIVAVVDFFDALTHDRPYRKKYPADQVLAMMQPERGRHFDPDVIDAFRVVVSQLNRDSAV
jgi:putative two-component system response regulator